MIINNDHMTRSFDQAVDIYWLKRHWIIQPCHCCAGIEWGGEYPRECRTCKGGANYWVHLTSRRMALWPGGPFVGTETEETVIKILDDLIFGEL
jgi:hypothetical protein